jgi:hypothetical protein
MRFIVQGWISSPDCLGNNGRSSVRTIILDCLGNTCSCRHRYFITLFGLSNSSVVPRQDSTMVGLLDASIKNLQAQGMRKMFLDGVSSWLSDLKKLGEQPSL